MSGRQLDLPGVELPFDTPTLRGLIDSAPYLHAATTTTTTTLYQSLTRCRPDHVADHAGGGGDHHQPLAAYRPGPNVALDADPTPLHPIPYDPPDASRISLGHHRHHRPALADMNHDGDPDLLGGNDSGQLVLY